MYGIIHLDHRAVLTYAVVCMVLYTLIMHDGAAHPRARTHAPPSPPFHLHSQAYDKIDIDGNGKIDLEELETTCKQYELSYDEAHVKEMLSNMDLNNDGCISFAEFRMFVLTLW